MGFNLLSETLMGEELHISAKDKEGKYQELLPQIKALLEGENDPIANMGNVAAALKFGLGFFWVGFYLVKENELVLGPFQGPVACTRIAKGKGVCGTCWLKEQTIIVEDVDTFPGHIACSSLSKSEIVLPFYGKNNKIIGVLDVDSEELNTFDTIDAMYLEQILQLL
jgi:L-methionine (R)-S-oxide reductase